MANRQDLALLKQGVDAWNNWRKENPGVNPNLSGAALSGTNLRGAYLRGAYLREANLSGVDLRGANLREANLRGANLCRANLREANLCRANLREANLTEATLTMAVFLEANLTGTDLRGADLYRADLIEADLYRADLREANLCRANLRGATLVRTNFARANLDSCFIYGISAWGVNLEQTIQSNLVITPPNEPRITVDNLEVAQFVYLLLNNQKIRDVINTIGKKGVLILGRFTERKNVLEAIRDGLRKRGYLPIVFDFERPSQRDFTETVMTLAGMCLFIIADITKPKSVPLELQATVPNYMIPFVPIIEKGEQPFSMFQDLWQKYRDWVLDPLDYDSVANLIDVFDQAVIEPAKRRRDELEARKAEALIMRHVEDYL
jgi:hypothetical protein